MKGIILLSNVIKSLRHLWLGKNAQNLPIQIGLTDIDYKASMLEMIRKLVDGESTVPEFEKAYYLFYLEEVPEDGPLSDRDWDFFGLVQERLEWTDENPDEESRSYGWHDHRGYVEYVRQLLECYKAGQNMLSISFHPEKSDPD